MNVCPSCAVRALFRETEEWPDIPGCVLEKLAGEGGMGRVYRARQVEAGGRQVAVKVLKESLTANARERFEREVALLSRLPHAHIAAVYGAGRMESGARFLIMEWIEGAPVLEVWRRQRQKADARRVTADMVRICEGVQAAHAVGVVHRDLKPANVLASDDGSVLKVVDFGLAREAENAERLSLSGAVVGTVGYMPLEQGKGQPAGPPADVFALGVMLFEGLTGRRPYAGDSLFETLRAQEESRMAGFGAEAPARDLQAIVRKALEPDAARRYRNAGEMAEDLRAFLDGLPVRAQPPSAVYRARKFAARHKFGVTAGVLGITAALAAGAWHLWSREQAARELRAQYADTLLVSAELASQRGQLEEALTFLTRAETEGARHPGRVAMARLAALGALGRRAEMDAVMRGAESVLAADADIPRGLPDYWRAQMCEGQEQGPSALALLRKAREQGLPPAEALIAAALLTEDEGEAEELLARAAREYPFHHQSLILHSLSLSLTGRREEARRAIETAARFFPKSENLAAAALLIAASSGSAELPAGVTLNNVSQEEVAGLSEVLGKLPNLYDLMWQSTETKATASRLFNLFSAVKPARMENVARLPSVAFEFMLRFRGRALKLISATLNPFTRQATHRAALAAEVARKSPSPLITGSLCAQLSPDTYKDAALRHEVEAAAAKVADQPRANDQERAVLLETAAAMAMTTGNLEKDDAAAQRGLDYSRRRAALTSVPVHGNPALMLCHAAVQWEAWDLARLYGARVLELSPEHSEARLCMAQVAAHEGEWIQCLRLLKGLPDDAGQKQAGLIKDLRTKAIHELNAAAKQHPEP